MSLDKRDGACVATPISIWHPSCLPALTSLNSCVGPFLSSERSVDGRESDCVAAAIDHGRACAAWLPFAFLIGSPARPCTRVIMVLGFSKSLSSSMRHCSTLKLSAYLRDRTCVVADRGIWQRMCHAAIHFLEVALQASPALLIIILQLWTLQSVLHDPRDVIHLHANTLESGL